MKFLTLVTLFFFSLPSCISEDNEDDRRFRGRSKTDKTIKRERPVTLISDEIPITESTTEEDTSPVATSEPVASNPVEETFVFPITLTSEHTLLNVQSDDHKKITVFAEPKNKAISIVAGLSGSVSVLNEEGLYTVVVFSADKQKTIHFELPEQDTTILVADGDLVVQRQNLATTTQPIVFFVTENDEQMSVLCISLDDLAKKIQVVKNFSEHSDCSAL